MGYTSEIIKEYNGQTVVLRTNTYCKAVPYILHLFNESKKDFPDLDEENVRVVTFSGRHYSGTMGIEFQSPWSIPKEYEMISELEKVL